MTEKAVRGTRMWLLHCRDTRIHAAAFARLHGLSVWNRLDKGGVPMEHRAISRREVGTSETPSPESSKATMHLLENEPTRGLSLGAAPAARTGSGSTIPARLKVPVGPRLRVPQGSYRTATSSGVGYIPVVRMTSSRGGSRA